MPEYVAIGSAVSVAGIRSYLFTKKIDKGDTLVLNAADYDHIIEEIRTSDEPIDIPLNVLGVLIVKDTSDEIPGGKVQIVKNEKTIE